MDLGYILIFSRKSFSTIYSNIGLLNNRSDVVFVSVRNDDFGQNGLTENNGFCLYFTFWSKKFFDYLLQIKAF
jgi:hypothetical protein